MPHCCARVALLLLLSAACVRVPDAPAVPGPACGLVVEAASPVAGSTGVDYRAPVVFEIERAGVDGFDYAATVRAPVAGTTTYAEGGARVVFTPDGPLDPDTDYRFTLDYCGGSVDLAFRTSPICTLPLDAELVGRAYGLPLRGGRSVGSQIGSFVQSYEGRDLLLSVEDETGAALGVAVGWGGDGEQDFCAATIATVASLADDPYFEADLGTVTLDLAGYDAPLYEARLSGVFAPDGSYVAAGSLAGTLDTRALGPLLGEDFGGDTGAFCLFFESFGEACAACPFDGAPYCLPLALEDIVGGDLGWSPLDRIAADDCPTCEEGPPEVCP